MNFIQLRKKHPQFVYEGFSINEKNGNLRVTFDFSIPPNIHFKPEITLPKAPKVKNIENLVFNLGLVEMLSYWKATCSPKITIKAGYLNEEQISFWKNLLIKGLGEFFYTNKIDFTQDGLVTFKVRSHIGSGNPFNKKLQDRDLILVGGGKDSAVTLDAIQKSGRQFNCLVLNPTKAAINISKAGGCKNPIVVQRRIDSELLELNKQGYLNGHTPFSAYLAFLGMLAGVVYDYKNIVVSNEASSNEANINWNGALINHQYSKTTEFEKNFRDYAKKYLVSDINYFSFLSSLGELQISKLFSKMEKYHKLFRSCNKGSRKGIWCGRCPKCVSTYLTLYPFLGNKTKEIFGKNLLDDKSLIPIVKALLRENNVIKPFECVATVKEIKTAIFLGIRRARKDGLKIPLVLKEYNR